MATETIGELVYKITGDASGLTAELKKTDKATNDVSSSTFSFKKILAGLFTGAVIAGVVNYTKKIIGLASTAEETNNKFGVVFDSVIDRANTLAETLADSFGLARTEAKALLADTGDLLVGFGVAKGEALDLSFQVQTLAVDLASFTNYAGGASGASKALTSALLGETEQAKALGLVLTDTALRQYAENNGLVFKELTQNEKMQLRLNLAISQSQSAVGDFNRSINSYANQMRIAEATTSDLQEQQGRVLLPVATALVKVFNEQTKELVKSQKAFADYVTSAEGAEEIGNILGTIALTIRTLYSLVIAQGREWVSQFDKAKSAVVESSDKFQEAFSNIKKEVQPLIDSFFDLAGSVESNVDLWTIFGGAILLVTIPIKAVGSLAVAVIKTIADLTLAISKSVSVISDFYRGFTENNFSLIKKSVVDAGALTSETFGAVKDNVGNAFSDIADDISNFSTRAQELGQGAKKTYKDLKDGITDATKSILTANQAVATGTGDLAQQQQQTKKTGKEVETLASKYAKLVKEIGQVGAALTIAEDLSQSFVSGFQNVLSAYGNYVQASADADTEKLDADLQRQLEAEGLAEESALQAAQRELDIAKEKGNKEEIQEKEKAVRKAEIEEQYQRRKAQIEYDAAVSGWQIQKALAGVQLLAAPLNAYVSSLTAPWPLNMILAPINAAIAAASAGLQYAAVAQAKPQKPKFQYGGVVPGSNYTGDNVEILANSGERVLTAEQQGTLVNALEGRGSSSMAPVIIDNESMFEMLFRASQDGRLFIDRKALTT